MRIQNFDYQTDFLEYLMKIMIVVPTYNRAKHIEIVAKSLSECKFINEANVCVYDDCSTEFQIDFLKKQFECINAKIIKRTVHGKNMEINTFEMMKDFINSNNDVMFICDSDLLLRPDSLEFLQNNFKYTDGFMSLYNSNLHLTVKTGTIFDLKFNVGFAGMCLSRKIVEKILAYDNPSLGDLKISETLSKNNIRALVPKQSYIQHIGIGGEHGTIVNGIDYSSTFEPISQHNKQIINEYSPIIANAQTNFIKKLLFEDKYRKDGFFIHQPLKHFLTKSIIKKLKKLEVK